MPKGQQGRGNIRDKVDRQLLHEFMWDRADHNHCFSTSQKELAEGLGITQATMSTILTEMCNAGRLRQVKWKFFVMDPSVYRWKNPPPKNPPSVAQPQLL